VVAIESPFSASQKNLQAVQGERLFPNLFVSFGIRDQAFL